MAAGTNAGANINAVCASGIARYHRFMSNERLRAVEDAITRHLRVDPVHDDRAADPEPFAPRYWRITE